MIRRY